MTGNLSLAHIGWAVESIEKAIQDLSALGFKTVGDVCTDDARKVKLALVSDSCGNTIELVSPMSEDSPVSEILQKNGPTPYHICFTAEVERDFGDCRKEFASKGFAVLHKPAPAPLFGGKDVVFLYSKNLGLIELVIEPVDGKDASNHD